MLGWIDRLTNFKPQVFGQAIVQRNQRVVKGLVAELKAMPASTTRRVLNEVEGIMLNESIVENLIWAGQNADGRLLALKRFKTTDQRDGYGLVAELGLKNLNDNNLAPFEFFSGKSPTTTPERERQKELADAQLASASASANASAGKASTSAGRAIVSAGKANAEPAGKASASAGRASASAGRASASAGRAIASPGKASAEPAGKAIASAGKASASAGRAIASAGKASASAGKAIASAGKASAIAGKASASAGNASTSAGRAIAEPAGTAIPTGNALYRTPIKQQRVDLSRAKPAVENPELRDWITMPLYARTLAQMGRPMGDKGVERLVGEITRALESLHGAGLAHMDVKPSNIFCDLDGRFLLGDFDAVRHVGTPTGTTTPALVPRDLKSVRYVASASHDYWMLGMTVYDVLSAPADDKTDDAAPERRRRVGEGPVDPSTAEVLAELRNFTQRNSNYQHVARLLARLESRGGRPEAVSGLGRGLPESVMLAVRDGEGAAEHEKGGDER